MVIDWSGSSDMEPPPRGWMTVAGDQSIKFYSANILTIDGKKLCRYLSGYNGDDLTISFEEEAPEQIPHCLLIRSPQNGWRTAEQQFVKSKLCKSFPYRQSSTDCRIWRGGREAKEGGNPVDEKFEFGHWFRMMSFCPSGLLRLSPVNRIVSPFIRLSICLSVLALPSHQKLHSGHSQKRSDEWKWNSYRIVVSRPHSGIELVQ